MTMFNVAEAKTQLSRLLDAALSGEEIVVARNGTPIVRLVPIVSPPERELGFLELDMPDDRFDPLHGEDLDGWT